VTPSWIPIYVMVIGYLGLDSVLLTEGCVQDPCYAILGVSSLLIVGAPNYRVSLSSLTGYPRYWLRRLDTGLLQWRSGFDLRPVHVWFMVNEVALGRVILQGLQFSMPVSFQK
jgi:hypothetical protein